MGMTALSVSTSAISSPARTLSPSFLCHLTTVPSVMVSESWGMVIWAGMKSSRGASQGSLREPMVRGAHPTSPLCIGHFADGGDDFFDAGLHGQLEKMVVGHGDFIAADAADGGVELVEILLVN